jgi:hypothetical protein
VVSNDFINNVSVTVPAHRSASPYRLSQGKFSDRREGLHEDRSSGTQAYHVSARPLNIDQLERCNQFVTNIKKRRTCYTKQAEIRRLVRLLKGSF